MKLFSYLVNLFLWEPKPFLKGLILLIMFTQNVFMIYFTIFYPDSI